MKAIRTPLSMRTLGNGEREIIANERFNRIFEEKHGSEAREYYMPQPAGASSTLGTSDDRLLVGRGGCYHTPQCKGCE